MIQENHHTQKQLRVNNIKNSAKKVRILIAEPEIDIQTIYRKCLASEASELTFASSSKELVEHAFDNNGGSSNNNHPSYYDVAIIDLHLDDMKGAKLGIGIVRKIAETLPDLRVIVTTTSDSRAEIREQLLSCGIDEDSILVKPFCIAELLSKIRPSKSLSQRRKVMLSDHVIAIYDSFEDEIQDAVAYFKGALEKNETMMLIFRKDLDVSLLKSELQRNGLDNIDQLLADYSLIMIRDQQFYSWSAAVDGNMIRERIISRLEQLIKISKDAGKRGIRSFAMTDSWFNNNMQSKLVDYEHSLPEVFDVPFIGVCAYLRHHVDSLTEKEKEKIMACHNLVWTEPAIREPRKQHQT